MDLPALMNWLSSASNKGRKCHSCLFTIGFPPILLTRKPGCSIRAEKWKGGEGKVNLYIHTIADERGGRPEEMLEKSASLGLRGMAFPDHDPAASLGEDQILS